jgi:hypothetical protein
MFRNRSVVVYFSTATKRRSRALRGLLLLRRLYLQAALDQFAQIAADLAGNVKGSSANDASEIEMGS